MIRPATSAIWIVGDSATNPSFSSTIICFPVSVLIFLHPSSFKFLPLALGPCQDLNRRVSSNPLLSTLAPHWLHSAQAFFWFFWRMGFCIIFHYFCLAFPRSMTTSLSRDLTSMGTTRPKRNLTSLCHIN
jgi:hypothetical protein